MSASSLVQRASGILVPSATLDKTQRTVLATDFNKQFERFMQFAGNTYGMLTVFHCMACKARIRMRRHGRLVDTLDTPEGSQDAPGGQISLFCDCTEWHVR